MTTLRKLLLAVALLSAAVLGACSRDDNTGVSTTTTAAGVEFLMYPNPQSSLGVADYAVLFQNTTLPVNPTPYTLTVRQTDGSVQTFTGNITALLQIITHNFEVTHPGGATITLDSGGATAIMVLRAGAASSNLAVSSIIVNPSIDLPRHQIDSTAYATAYYAAIDPTNDRETLAEFKGTNGFSAVCAPNGTTEFEVRFRDVFDLGYGRHMCARGSTTAVGNVAVWVENFQVTAIPGVKYGPLNLEAVVNDDRRWHIGTNAIEYSATPSSVGVRILKFYTFNPDGTRRLLVDLDGRGAKAMPVPCISCHGGHALPLTANGLFPAIRTSPPGDTLARMQPLNVGTLDFSPNPPYRRADQEASLKAINRLVLCTFPLVGAAGAGGEDNCRSADANLEWGGTAASMVKSWYGGTGANGLPNAAFSDTFVPPFWQPGGGVPANAPTLYNSVVATTCRVCHLLRGNQNNSGIDFTAYENFADTDPTIGYNSRIKHHVFDRGNMPLALLKFDTFWESTAPTTLAAFIVNATDSNGNVLRPTRPVAKTGPNRTVRTGIAARLSAAESVNAASYRWRITSANFANAVLTNTTTIRPTFTANVNGTYTVELIVSNGSTDSTPATLTIFANSTIADPSTIRFSHVRNILQGAVAPVTGCTGASCHTDPTANPSGPPVYYTDYDRDGGGVGASDLHQFYLDIRARINFTDIESSRILFRPSGHHHPGGLWDGFDINNQINAVGDRTHYDTFLNWILNGAPE